MSLVHKWNRLGNAVINMGPSHHNIKFLESTCTIIIIENCTCACGSSCWPVVRIMHFLIDVSRVSVSILLIFSRELISRIKAIRFRSEVS